MNARVLLKLTALAALAAPLAGCVSLEDFMKMPPSERARMVCSSGGEMPSLKSRASSLDSDIAEAQANLARGYGIRNECYDVEVIERKHEVCRRVDGKKVCTYEPRRRTEQRCHDVRVPISRHYESRRLSSLESERAHVQERIDALYGPCLKAVAPMSAEEAFWYYDNGRLPG
ncbi:MAG: hypothetical protein HUK26_07315, partial [Duodenibacillus sp.]|nr:hypothetical protein [Duodenibacillus sp.]